jgi:acetyl esterase/lipase
VPYTNNANKLQNLDVWIPAQDGSSIPTPSTRPKNGKGVWVIFIHGGAWRDPLVSSSSFSPTVTALGSTHDSSIFSLASEPDSSPRIAGIASLNYSLTRKIEDDEEPSHQAKHPDHILDVLKALSYLQALAGFGSNYVLLGHSCGATLSLQVIMQRSRWITSQSSENAELRDIAKPIAVIGLNGLYDMPALVHSPGPDHTHLQSLYEIFIRKAFGDDEEGWKAISPVTVEDWKNEWKEGVKIVLAQSKEDTLVSYEQLERMRRSLLASKSEGLELGELTAGGDHNDLWEKGDRLAEIVVEVVKSLP